MNTYKVISGTSTYIVIAKSEKKAEQMAKDFYGATGQVTCIRENVSYQSGNIPSSSIRPAVKY